VAVETGIQELNSRDRHGRSTVAVKTGTEVNSGSKGRHTISTMAEKTDTGAQKFMAVASLVAKMVTEEDIKRSQNW
jgi:hypothetical protein